MQRLQKVLNHCSNSHKISKRECVYDASNSEYIHFWRRPKGNKNKETATRSLHDEIANNERFQNEVDKDRNDLLSDVKEYFRSNQHGNEYYDTKDIMKLFLKWMNVAIKYSPTFIKHANAVCLSTVDGNGCPSARYVLLKTIDIRNGHFIFFTNYGSNKAKEISACDRGAMTFYWHNLEISIRIKGELKKIDDDELNDKYWSTRPRKSKLSAITSNQSQIIESANDLEQRYKENEEKLKNVESEQIRRPKNWGGFALDAQSIEFWNGHKFRFHHRTLFTKDQAKNRWNVPVSLQP